MTTRWKFFISPNLIANGSILYTYFNRRYSSPNPIPQKVGQTPKRFQPFIDIYDMPMNNLLANGKRFFFFHKSIIKKPFTRTITHKK